MTPFHQGTAGRSATVTASLANGQGGGCGDGGGAGPDRRRVAARGGAGPGAGLDLGERGPLDGDGDVDGTVERRGDGHGVDGVVERLRADGTTLTIAAGATTSAGLVTLRGTDNAVASGSRQVTVSATAAGGNGVANPADAALTVTDDDAPRSALVLSSNSIAENGGVATVTATLDRQSTVAVTVTVAAAAGGERGRGRLRPERGGDADIRGQRDDERGSGDGDGGEQYDRRAEQERDGLGHGFRQPRADQQPAVGDAGDYRRRRGAGGDAVADPGEHRGERGRAMWRR